MNSTSIRLGGDTSGIPLDWVTVAGADIINGFGTQAANPLQYVVATMLGGNFLIFRGTLIIPNPKPLAATEFVRFGAMPKPAFRSYNDLRVASTGWNVVGRRSVYDIRPTTYLWAPESSSVAGEVDDMSALSFVRIA